MPHFLFVVNIEIVAINCIRRTNYFFHDCSSCLQKVGHLITLFSNEDYAKNCGYLLRKEKGFLHLSHVKGGTSSPFSDDDY